MDNARGKKVFILVRWMLRSRYTAKHMTQKWCQHVTKVLRCVTTEVFETDQTDLQMILWLTGSQWSFYRTSSVIGPNFRRCSAQVFDLVASLRSSTLVHWKSCPAVKIKGKQSPMRTIVVSRQEAWINRGEDSGTGNCWYNWKLMNASRSGKGNLFLAAVIISRLIKNCYFITLCYVMWRWLLFGTIFHYTTTFC